MPATDYFENLMLGYVLRQQAFVVDPMYIGLWLSSPGSTGDLSGEVSAGEYVRKTVTWDSNNSNTSVLDWAAATSTWGTINYVCALNSPVKGTGNMLFYQAVGSPFTVTIGEPVTIPAGGITVAIS